MIARTIGRRYAKALLAVTVERGEQPEKILAELEVTAAALAAEPRFAQLLANPKILLDKRLGILDRLLDILKPQALVRHFFKMLLTKGRLGILAEIVAEFRIFADWQAGILRASVFSTTPLAAAETERLHAMLGKRFGKIIHLSSAVDPGLIGGLVVRVGNLSFDGSIRSQLQAIHRQLMEEVTFS